MPSFLLHFTAHVIYVIVQHPFQVSKKAVADYKLLLLVSNKWYIFKTISAICRKEKKNGGN